MRIDNIHICGFRCFDHYEATLRPKANILIGRNGAGKSTLIHAIAQALSFIFSTDKSLGKDFISASNSTLNVRGFAPQDFHFYSDSREYSAEASIKVSGHFGDKPLTWELYKRNQPGSSLYPSRYKEAFTTLTSAVKGGEAWPLLAYYSDSYPHVYSRVTAAALNAINMDEMPRNFGYYQWDDETSCTAIWEARLCSRIAKLQPLYAPAAKTENAVFAKEKNAPADMLAKDPEYRRLLAERDRIEAVMKPLKEEIEYVQGKLSRFIAQLKGVQYEGFGIDYFTSVQTPDGYKLAITFGNGQTDLLQDLPAGYRRLYSIVIDMAYRSYILNKGAEPSGVAIIDEIDLHLHPAIEQAVLGCFTAIFPGVQFIVSTHSASVVSNTNTSEGLDNQVLAMSVGAEHPTALPNLIGVDYNAVLRDFMDAPARNDDLRKLEDLYLSYLSMDLKAEAKAVYSRIVDIVHGDAAVLNDINGKAAKYDVH